MMGLTEPDSTFLHNHLTNSESEFRRLLGLTPDTQWEKVCLCHRKPRNLPTLLRVVFTIGSLMLSWLGARYLHNHERDSEPHYGRFLSSMPATQGDNVSLFRIMNPPTLVGVVCIIGTIAVPEADGWFIWGGLTDFESVNGPLIGLIPTTRWYKGHLCGIETYEVANPSAIGYYKSWSPRNSGTPELIKS